MLIDNKDALTAVDDCNYKIMSGYEWIRKQEIKKRLKVLPSAERVGHWTKRTTVTSNGNTYYSYECSECGDHHGTMWKYCPHCGARMVSEDV